MVLNALSLGGLLEPLQVMMAKMLGFLPNLLAAAAILLVGWFLARIVQRSSPACCWQSARRG